MIEIPAGLDVANLGSRTFRDWLRARYGAIVNPFSAAMLREAWDAGASHGFGEGYSNGYEYATNRE